MNALWSASPERIRRAQVTRFMHFVQERHKAPVHDYPSLHRWSVEFPEHFWSALWDFCEVRAERQAACILEDGNRMPGAKWFSGARFNYAENLLRLNDDTAAIIFRRESGERRELSWRELRGEVARIADGLRQAGVEEGNRVAGYLPSVPEAVIAMLATTSIGAIWSSCSPELGIAGALDRLGRIGPKVLFAAGTRRYAGKDVDCMPDVQVLTKTISGIKRVVAVGAPAERPSPRMETIAFDDFGSAKSKLLFAQMPFDQPAFILYSPGTAGALDCIVHGAGGALLQQLKEHVLHADVERGSRYLHFTTCGGVMWHSLVSGLAAGATIVLFDGAPLPSDPRTLWRIVEEEQVEIFGITPPFLTASEQAGIRPREEFGMAALRTILSSGSPLSPENHRYVYDDVKQDVQLSSIAAGADIMGCFGSGCPILSAHPGETQCLSLGMKVQVYDDAGRAIIDAPGELVCTEPFPSMPVGLWGDADGSRFRATYFQRYRNVWWHADRATITKRGGLIMQMAGN